MTITFDKTQPDRCLITDTATPHFILPYLGLRYLCIKEATPSLQITTAPSGKAHLRLATAHERAGLPSVTGPHAWVRLVGQDEGKADVTLREGTQTLQFEVNVLPWRWLSVNFFLVEDANGSSNFYSSRTGTHVSRLDKVYRAQTCVDFHRHLPTRWVKVSMDCSQPMTAAEEDAMWDAFRDKTPSTVRGRTFFNIFVVKEWGGHDDPTTGYNAWATSHGIYIVIDDSALSNTGPVLPHEVGHSLGLAHFNTDGYVMRQGLNKGWKLTWDHVQTVRTYVD